MAKVYITFDGIYSIKNYNDFVNTAKAKKIELKEFINIRPPYRWYIQIEEKYLPVFLNYAVLPKADEKWLLEKMIPLNPMEEYILTRKVSDLPQDFQNFVSPNIFKDIPSADYCVMFKYKNKDELIKISKEIGIKIYVLGMHRGWNLAFTFNKYIRNYIYLDQIILEKKKPSDYQKAGEFEYTLNFKKLVKVKLTNKTLDYPYYEDGTWYPLKKRGYK